MLFLAWRPEISIHKNILAFPIRAVVLLFAGRGKSAISLLACKKKKKKELVLRDLHEGSMQTSLSHKN